MFLGYIILFSVICKNIFFNILFIFSLFNYGMSLGIKLLTELLYVDKLSGRTFPFLHGLAARNF